MFVILISILFANVVKSQETNVTCADGRVCFLFNSFEEHCEILVGDNCHPPCDRIDCKIKVENNVLCEHYFCTDPIPPAPKPSSANSFLNILEGAIGSFISSAICLFLYTFYKRRQARRQRILEIINNEANITGRENEGDSQSRSIIRHPPSQQNSPTSPQVPTSTGISNPFASPELPMPPSSSSNPFGLSPIPENPSTSSAILTPTSSTPKQMNATQLSPSSSPLNPRKEVTKKKVNHFLNSFFLG